MSRAAVPSPNAPQPIRVLSIKDAQPVVVRFLDQYQGLVLHWKAGGSVPCEGEHSCPQAVHRCRIFWRGYAPSQVWLPSRKGWLPCVLEITERLEQLLAGRQLRGEIWKLWRPRVKKTGSPVLGEYQETQHPELLPAAIDIEPVLIRLFHCTHLLLGAENPIPAPLLGDLTPGFAPREKPTASAQEEEKKPRKSMRELDAEYRRQRAQKPSGESQTEK